MSEKFNNMSFRTKLLLSYIAVIILCIIIFGLTVFSSISRRFENEITDNNAQITGLAVNNMTNTMNNIEQILYSVQANSTIKKMLTASNPPSPYEEIAAIEQELSKIDPLKATVSRLSLYIENRTSYPSPFDSNVTASVYSKNEVWYKNTKELNGSTYWCVMDSSDANGLLCVARAFIDTRTHKILGIIRADVNLSQFTNDIAHISMNNTGKLFLVYENHIINTWNDSYINNFVNENEFFKAISADSDKPQLVQINKEKHIINHSRLKDSSLILVRASKLDDFNSDIHIIEKSMITTGIIALLVALIFIFIFTRWLTAPITKLIKHMERFENNYERIPIEITSHDEMGKLGESYNSMLNTIDFLITDVEDLYKKQKIFELKTLQAQINPHFLYNTLDSIHWMARAHHAPDISKMVSALGTFFRHSLNKGNEYTTIENELNQISSYVSIQKIRFEDKFDVVYDIDENLLHCTIVKLTIQPLVENSIIHGFDEIEEGGMITIRIYPEDDYIFIDVIDNGSGTDTNELNKAITHELDYNEPIEKYGLTNVNLRIQLYFDKTCGLSFKTNETGGVTATIKIKRKEPEYKTIDL